MKITAKSCFGGETQVAGSLTIRLSQSPVMQRYLPMYRKISRRFLKKVLQRFGPTATPNAMNRWIFYESPSISALC